MPHELLRSLTKTTQTPVEAVVRGEIPKWVNGTLFRNGPGRFKYGDKTYKHLFDGHACIQKFKIDNGRVFFSNKFLETKSYTKSLAETRLYPVFGTPDLCSSIFGRFQTFFGLPDTMDNVNVNVVPYGNDLYALTETSFICKIDPSNLDIKETLQVSKYIPSTGTTFAHPHVDTDGTWITMGMNPKGRNPSYEFIRYKGGETAYKVNNIGEAAELIASVPSSHSFGLSYFHSFGLSENYIIFLEQSLVFSQGAFLKGLVTNTAFSDALIMNKDLKTRIHIIDKKTGKIHGQKFVTDPMFTFHHINAFEKFDENNQISEIIVDICAYDANHFEINQFAFEDMFTEKALQSKGFRSIARRLTIPFNKTDSTNEIHCKIEDIAPVAFELPTTNYNVFNGKPYKYFYGANFHKSPFSIVKVNVDSGEFIEKVYSDGSHKFLPSEPIFVENPNPTSEDDGVLLVMVLSDKNDYLSVLDAKTLEEIAVADVSAEAQASFTFHGFFADTKNFVTLNA